MRLDELLDKIDHESEIALQIEQPDGEVSKTSVREVWKFGYLTLSVVLDNHTTSL